MQQSETRAESIGNRSVAKLKPCASTTTRERLTACAAPLEGKRRVS